MNTNNRKSQSQLIIRPGMYLRGPMNEPAGSDAQRTLPVNPGASCPRPLVADAGQNAAACCDGPGTLNDVGALLELDAVNCECPGDPTSAHQWNCEGREMLPPVMFNDGWKTQTIDFLGFRDKNMVRHFLRHAGCFQTAPNLINGALVGADLVVAVPPTSMMLGGAAVPANSLFSMVRVDINTPLINFTPTTLNVSVGPTPTNPFDNGPVALSSWTEPGETLSRQLTGVQLKPQVTLILPLGLVRANQSFPNVLNCQWMNVGGLYVPFNVRVSGAAPGTTIKAQVVANATASIGEIARSV